MPELSKNLHETSGACIQAQLRSKCGSPSDFVRDVPDNNVGLGNLIQATAFSRTIQSVREQSMAPVNNVFTSWKEVANYLGKSIRTVQRWEAQLGLPVHRPHITHGGIVRATKDELDAWIASVWSERNLKKRALSDELMTLRTKVAALEKENATLKQELEKRDRAASVAELSASSSEEIKPLLERCEQLLRRTELLHPQYAETLDASKNLREIRRTRSDKRVQ